MTKEPIMIEGVDVSECKDFFESECFAGEKFRWCKDNKDCYFKQLKRKKQECEKFKQSLKEIKEITFEPRIFGFWDEQLDRIKKKCEVLND